MRADKGGLKSKTYDLKSEAILLFQVSNRYQWTAYD
jgi:hypothetical protein